jgi:hypothetical protein
MAPAPEPPPEPARDGQKKRRDASSPDAAPSATATPVTSSGGEAEWRVPHGGFDSFRDAAVHLRRPFTPAAVKFKVQAVFGKPEPTGCLIVSYIDARLAVERLNLVCPDWEDEYTATSNAKFLQCALTVAGLTRKDVGEAAGLSKDQVSDALKRAAVKFGVGVSLYAIPQIKLFKEHIGNGNLKVTTNAKGEKTLVVTDKGDALLRKGYTKWLEEHGVQAFGPPLDHGDREGHMDTPEAAVPDERPSPEAEQASDDAARAYRESVKDAA